MDEPTNGLDPNQLLEARKLIKEIARDHAVLLSSHILSEINLLCKDIIMIASGRIVFADTMDAFDNYLQPQSIILKMENPPSREDLLRVQGVTGVTFLSQKELRVDFDGDLEISERLVAASVQHNWRLRELSLEKRLLDDTFKQLSSNS